MTAEDLRLVGEWMKMPHWQEWWGESEGELNQIRDMIAGRDTTRPFLFLIDGRPAGYIQYWFVGHYQNRSWTDANPWLLEFPEDTVGVDLSVGASGDLGKGYGSKALGAFSTLLHKLGHETIIIDPDPENGRAIRAYEKAGFEPIGRLAGKTDGVHLMQFNPERVSQ